MKTIKFGFILMSLLVSGMSLAQNSLPQFNKSKEEFCNNVNNPDYFKAFLFNQANLLSFKNPLGLTGGGICWWHSMYQRNATYLMVFKPELPKPTDDEARSLIQDIIAEQGVVEIPGFHNLNEFSKAYEKDMIRAISAWQIGEGLLQFGWLNGLKGSSQISASEFKQSMDELYDRVMSKKEITFQMLQFPGILAHSWLVVDMDKIDHGYILYVIDSLREKIIPILYTDNLTQFNFAGKPDRGFVPYTQRTFTFNKYKNIHEDYCKNGKTSVDYRQHKGPMGL